MESDLMQEPKSTEHEKVVIAGMMNDESIYYDAVAELDEEHFSNDDLKNIYKSLVKLGSVTADSLIRAEENPRQQALIKTVDGEWTNKSDFEFSLQELKKVFLKRQLYHTLKKTVNRFNEAEYEELIEGLERELNQASSYDNNESIIDPQLRAIDAYEEFVERRLNPDSAKGIPFSLTNDNGTTIGFPSLDRALNGAYGGDLIMIAAKTGVGKTGFALNLARHFSFRQSYRGYYMNTEMRIVEMESRLLADIAQVNANEIMYGRLEGTKDEILKKEKRITQAFEKYRKSNLIMSRIPDLPLHKAKGLARQVKSRYEKLDYIIIDYVGRMEIAGKDLSTWDELYEITKELKELAMLLDVPIFMLAQRNQAGDVEGAKKMMNECDAVLYFEPVTESDKEYIQSYYNPNEQDLINYKLIKQKVRRDDNPYPIYVVYDRAKNFINEVT